MLVRYFVECPSTGICVIFFLMMILRLLVFGRETTEVKASLITFISRILKEKLISSTYNTSDTKCVDFPHQAILQFTNWVSYSLIHSDTDCPELAQTLQVKDSVSQTCPLPHFRLETRHKSGSPIL